MYLLEESVAVSVCGNRQLAYDLVCRVTRAPCGVADFSLPFPNLTGEGNLHSMGLSVLLHQLAF